MRFLSCKGKHCSDKVQKLIAQNNDHVDWYNADGKFYYKDGLFHRVPRSLHNEKAPTSSTWVALLTKNPQYADSCDWSKFDGRNWAKLLALQPQFAEKCDWCKLNCFDWLSLLVEQPQFAAKCNWNIINRPNLEVSAQRSFSVAWSILLAKQPQFAIYCDWDKIHLDGETWVTLLAKQPRFADKCEWNKLSCVDWMSLLNEQPQFADKCNWNIVKEPQFAYKWDKLDGTSWVKLIIRQPRFAGHCDWSKLSCADWLDLLIKQPQFADKCNWNKVNAWSRTDNEKCGLLWRSRPSLHLKSLPRYGEAWLGLLSKQPQFAVYCDWSKFDGADWVKLLVRQPQFADKCNWSRFSEEDKKWLMRHFLDFKYSRVTSVTHRIPVNRHLARIENEEVEEKVFKKDLDWDDLSGNDIVQLLGTFPQLVGECDLMRLTVGNWVDLLEREPAFAAQCSHLQKEIEAERQKRKEEIAWELEKYGQERDAEAAELSHKFDLECDDPEYADMEYWNTH